jgi:hypothetical protein
MIPNKPEEYGRARKSSREDYVDPEIGRHGQLIFILRVNKKVRSK